MTPEIWQSLIALIGVMYAATIAAIFKNRQPPPQAEEKTFLSRHDFITQLKNTTVCIRDWITVEREVRKLITETSIDRFLLLVAINGDRNMTHATVIWERRQPPWELDYHYEDVRIDQDYNDRLDYIRRNMFLKFRTDEAQNTMIGGFYETEKVQESIWAMVAKKKNPDTAQDGYLYFSAATHSDDGIDEDAVRRVLNIKADIMRCVVDSGFRPI